MGTKNFYFERVIELIRDEGVKLPKTYNDYVVESINDESFSYRGYLIKILKGQRDGYHLSIYKDDDYVMGIKGLLPLKDCQESGKKYVDNIIDSNVNESVIPPAVEKKIRERIENRLDHLKNGSIDAFDFMGYLSKEFIKPIDKIWAKRNGTFKDPYTDRLAELFVEYGIDLDY